MSFKSGFNRIFIIIILAILGIGGYLAHLLLASPKILEYITDEGVVSSEQPSRIPTLTPSEFTTEEGWQTYQNTRIGYTLRYPQEAKLSTPDESEISTASIIRIYYMGETQRQSGRTQTELADGYIINIREVAEAPGDPAIEFATLRRENTIENCSEYEGNEISEIKQIQLNGNDAYTYSVKNCRVDYEAYFIDNQPIIEIIGMYPAFNEEDKQAYLNQVNSIAQSFKKE